MAWNNFGGGAKHPRVECCLFSQNQVVKSSPVTPVMSGFDPSKPLKTLAKVVTLLVFPT